MYILLFLNLRLTRKLEILTRCQKVGKFCLCPVFAAVTWMVASKGIAGSKNICKLYMVHTPKLDSAVVKTTNLVEPLNIGELYTNL